MAAVVEPPDAAREVSTSAPTRLGYQPALDGLRAVAIVSVMVFHAGFEAPALFHWGSWLGVDLFFVLSGFLITTLLLREFGADGRVSLRNFYVRRGLRLYPLIAVCIALAVIYMLWPGHRADAPNLLGLASIAGYFTNWLTVLRGGPHDLGSFAHLWSLAIEEQFYVVWPLLVVTVLKAGGRRKALLLVSTGLTVTVVLVRYKVWLDARNFHREHYFEFQLAGRHLTQAWNTVYYGTFTHTDGLLIGCALAALLGMHPTVPRRSVRSVVGVLAWGAVVLNYLIFRGTIQKASPTFLTTWGLITFNLGVAVITAHVLFSPRAPMARLLSVRPLVWIGRRSYAMYVLHIFVLNWFSAHDLVEIPWLMAAIALTMCIAGISYRYYEAPILRLKRRFESQ